VKIDSGWDTTLWAEGDGFVGKRVAPFPHRSEWNDLSGMPAYDEYDEADPEACARWELEQERFEARYGSR